MVNGMPSLSELSGALDLVIRASKMVANLKNKELVGLISEIQNRILKFQIHEAELIQENMALKRKLSLQEEYVFDKNEGAYFAKDDFELEKPICPQCFVQNGRVSPMQVFETVYVCNACGKQVQSKSHLEAAHKAQIQMLEESQRRAKAKRDKMALGQSRPRSIW